MESNANGLHPNSHPDSAAIQPIASECDDAEDWKFPFPRESFLLLMGQQLEQLGYK